MGFDIPFDSIIFNDPEFFMLLGLAFDAIPDTFLNMLLVGLLISVFGSFLHFVIQS